MRTWGPDDGRFGAILSGRGPRPGGRTDEAIRRSSTQQGMPDLLDRPGRPRTPPEAPHAGDDTVTESPLTGGPTRRPPPPVADRPAGPGPTPLPWPPARRYRQLRTDAAILLRGRHFSGPRGEVPRPSRGAEDASSGSSPRPRPRRSITRGHSESPRLRIRLQGLLPGFNFRATPLPQEFHRRALEAANLSRYNHPRR